MTVKEYNEMYSDVGGCKVVLDHFEEIIKDKDIERLCSLVPDNFVQILNIALDMYLLNMKLQISASSESPINKLEPFLNWCERTGTEFTSENYDEWLTHKAIEEIFKDN